MLTTGYTRAGPDITNAPDAEKFRQNALTPASMYGMMYLRGGKSADRDKSQWRQEMTTEATTSTEATTPEAPAAEMSELQKLEAQETELEAEVTRLQTETDEKIAKIISTATDGSYDAEALVEAGTPVKTARARLTALRERIVEARKTDAWESSIALREPALQVIHDLIVDAKPTGNVTDVSGELVIDDDGNVNVKLTPVVKAPDLSDVESFIAETVNVPAFRERGFTRLIINVSGIGGEKPLTSIALPTDKPKAKAKTASATTSANGDKAKSGDLEWNVDGQWLSSKAMLQYVNDHADDPRFAEHVKSHQTGLTNVLAGGNGMSNLAKRIGRDKLKLQEREADPDA